MLYDKLDNQRSTRGQLTNGYTNCSGTFIADRHGLSPKPQTLPPVSPFLGSSSMSSREGLNMPEPLDPELK